MLRPRRSGQVTTQFQQARLAIEGAGQAVQAGLPAVQSRGRSISRRFLPVQRRVGAVIGGRDPIPAGMLSIRVRSRPHPRVGYIGEWPVPMLARPAGGSVARIGCLVPEEAVLVAPLSGGVSLQAGLITQRPWLLIGLLGVVPPRFFCLTHRGHVSVPIWGHICAAR